MTIVTKVGVSYDDHMNDDALEVDSFFSWMLPGSLLPPFLRREFGTEATLPLAVKTTDKYTSWPGHVLYLPATPIIVLNAGLANHCTLNTQVH